MAQTPASQPNSRKFRSQPPGVGLRRKWAAWSAVMLAAVLGLVWYFWEIESSPQFSRDRTFRGESFVAFGPGGRSLATQRITADQRIVVTIREVSTGRELKRLNLGEPVGLDWSTDGHYFASASNGGVVTLWDVDAGTEGRELAVQGYTTRFTPDGRYLVASGYRQTDRATVDKVIRLWDIVAEREVHVLKIRGQSAWALAISPDGRYLGVAEGHNIEIWDLPKGTLLYSPGCPAGCSLALAFTPDGRYLAAPNLNYSITLWEVATGQEARILRKGSMEGGVAIAISPDSCYLATLGQNTIELWKVGSGRKLRTLRLHDAGPQSLAFSPDGRYLAAGYYDRTDLWLRQDP